MGFEAQGGDFHVLQEVGVVGVEDGAIRHGAGQIGAPAAVHLHLQLQPAQPPGVVKAHGVVVGKGVAFAGDDKVVVAIQAQFHRAAQLVRGHGSPHRHVAGLGFFAAKPAPHAAAFHAHGVVVQTQGMSDPVLHFAGVLRATVD